ncbi:hypothetical protein ATK74_1914 [Propionicimonas paludicola]|uniref:PKD domain-containing protein n=1 Tax=Propionicimonas paludicola TaxID=185243 RepID=A0A2A9CSD1_9ACTN|nr:hypothetical protein ATK74_1914 [Propionicimonas paludicola]
MLRTRILTAAMLTGALLAAVPMAPALGDGSPNPRPSVGVDDGYIEGSTGIGQKDPSKPSKPNPPVEHHPPADSNPEDSLEGLDPALRAQIQQCLRDNPSDLCYEGLVSSVDVSAVAREVVARLHLPDPTPRFGPDPDANEWHMLAVGYPLWLWTSGPTRLTTTATRYGLSFTLTATWQDTRFEFGDGHSLTCRSTSPYPAATKPGTPSPTCGYTYQKVSPAAGYTVRAHTNWRVDWAAAGQSGSLDTTYTGSRTVQVGELSALIVR